MPVHFTYKRKRHAIREIFARFRTQSARHINGYLARADDNELTWPFRHNGG